MKQLLLGGTALAGSCAIISATAGAAEAPTWKLTGNANFQFYWVDQDRSNLFAPPAPFTISLPPAGTTSLVLGVLWWDTTGTPTQDHDWYFGVDEAELQLNVSGTADNGLNYGFKIEINANTTDEKVADEARLQFSGGWGTLQMGDEDGAEDIMNYGGENLMGATGGFDGDQDDYLILCTAAGDNCVGSAQVGADNDGAPPLSYLQPVTNLAAPSYPTIAGDTSDQTKISYFSPRFAGFQVGASLTPTPNNGDDFKADGAFENHIGVGANYDNSFGGLRLRASAVYSSASATGPTTEDISAWSVGGIVGWGPVSVGANFTDNGDSGRTKAVNQEAGSIISAGIESSYWNVAAGYEAGPMYFSAGYFSGLTEAPYTGDSTYEHFALTADYTLAPGLGLYAELNLIDISLHEDLVAAISPDISQFTTNSATSVVIGANVSF